jgi:uncharacterized protein
MTKNPVRYPRPAPIDAYGNGGFRFADMSHRGSILCLPSGVYAWDVGEPANFNPEQFEPVFAEKGAVDLLLLGTGRTQVFPSAALREAFVKTAVALEVMDTGAACRTYNVLLGEGRRVAAALVAVE